MNDILEKFRNGDLDIESIFGTYENLFKALKRRNLLDEVDPRDSVNPEDWENKFFMFLIKNDRELFYKWMDQELGDVKFDNAIPTLVLDDRGDLSELFCDSDRYGMSQDAVKNILSNESEYFDYFSYDSYDIYDEVISELDEKNINRLCEYIVKTLNGAEISTNSELFETIAEEQGHPDHAIITNENVKRVVDDEESMDLLLEDELDDLKSDLRNIYEQANNNAYESELSDGIFKELDTYFNGHGEFISIPHKFKENTTIQKYELPIHDFDGIIYDYLSDGYHTIDYFGNYLGILKDSVECLSVRTPDYADSSLVREYINEMFVDYI